ncbi:MAG: translation elongation factor Ts [Clostridia bacterium]|nr:translation elongation factor Ts [Clostridia bacterium]
MAAITAKMVSELRAKTNAGMMECKKALTEANGDFDEAAKILRERGLAGAAKKAGRIAAEGVVDIMTEGDKAVIIEVNTETDFATKNDVFKEFLTGVEKAILANNPADVDAVLALEYEAGMTVDEKLKEMIGSVIRENMSIRRFAVVEGTTSTYVHGGGAAGVVVKFNADDAAKSNPGFAEFAKNIALQIAAGSPPSYVCRDEVPASAVEEEKQVILNTIKNDEKNANKPDAILEKMVVGKLGKFYERVCLVDQAYVKDDGISVGKYIANCAKEFGGEISVDSFVLYEMGEGLEKKEDNFGDEIAELLK